MKPIFSAALLAGIAASGASYAAAEKPTSSSPAMAQTEQGATGRHSHMQEKTGIPQKMPEKKTDKPSPAVDMSKHYHPRDGK